jgi:ketosteroid isomerase-like protein
LALRALSYLEVAAANSRMQALQSIPASAQRTLVNCSMRGTATPFALRKRGSVRHQVADGRALRESNQKSARTSDAPRQIESARLVLRMHGDTGMAVKRAQEASSQDEMEIGALIDRWVAAIRAENREAIRAEHDSEILMFDVPPPFLSQGMDAYMATWELFFSRAERAASFGLRDVKVTAGKDVGFATATGRCVDFDAAGKRDELAFRLTMGFRKIAGRWRIVHEHHSVPAS